MTYPPGLTDLPHEVAERVRPPGFDEVLARASAARRRRRTTIAAGLAATVAVGGLAFAVSDASRTTSRSDDVGGPSPTQTWDGSSEVDPSLPAEVRQLLESDFLDPRYTSGSGEGVATIWHACPDGEDCRLVLTTRVGDVTDGWVLDGTSSTLAPVPGAWLVQDETGVRRLTLDGEWQAVTEADHGGTYEVGPGDISVGGRMLQGNELFPKPSPVGRTTGSYTTPDGRLLVASQYDDDVQVAWTEDRSSWQLATTATRGYGRAVWAAPLAGHGDHVVLAAIGDWTDGSLPVRELQVSHDAGDTWTSLDVAAIGGLRDLSGLLTTGMTGLAVSDEGTVFLTTGSHGLVRFDANGDVRAESMSSHDHSVFVAGDRVCLVAEAGLVDQLRCSTDDGETWESTPLPGFR